jgi:hypothetical protein
MRWAAAVLLLATPVPVSAMAEDITLPSGNMVTLVETIRDAAGPEGLTDRFRFLAPWIADADYGAVAADIDWLCETVALPRVVSSVPPPLQIVLSLADREVAFGASDPDAVQFFEAYGIEGDTCVPEFF